MSARLLTWLAVPGVGQDVRSKARELGLEPIIGEAEIREMHVLTPRRPSSFGR